MEILGKLKHVDFTKLEVTLKLAFITEETIETIRRCEETSKPIRFKISGVRKQENLSDEARGRWFLILSKILKFKDKLTTEYLNAFHKEMKKSKFSVRTLIIDKPGKQDEIIPIIPSIMELSDEEVHEACNEIILDYSELGIDFDENTNE